MADAELKTAVGWGGPVWEEQVSRGLDWLGDLTDARVLEIGTRTGEMAVHLASRGAIVTGLDVVPSHLTVARERAEAAGLSEQVEFATYSGNPADLPRGFDVIFTKSTLVLIDDLRAAAAAISASLVSGGRLVAIENARGPAPIHVARMLSRRSRRPRGANYFTSESVRHLEQHLRLSLVRWTVFPPTVLVCASRA